MSRRPCEQEDCPQCNRIERNAEEKPIHVPKRLPRPESSPEQTHNEETEETLSAIDTRTVCNPWVENMSSTVLQDKSAIGRPLDQGGDQAQREVQRQTTLGRNFSDGVQNQRILVKLGAAAF